MNHNSPIGRSWTDARKELLSPKEIRSSDRRIRIQQIIIVLTKPFREHKK